MEAWKINGIGFSVANWPLDPAKSTIVFMHGAAGSGNFWQAQVEGLAARANTLSVDLPGHGRSDGEGMASIEEYAAVVADFLNQLDVPNPIPCGLSMGGAITLQLMLNCPHMLKAGILIGTGARLKVAPIIFETLEKDYGSYVKLICKLVAGKATDSEVIRRFREETSHCNPKVAHNDFVACNGFDVMQKIESITLPVLVVSSEDDQLTPTKYGEFLKDSIPGATGTHILGAGHILPMEKPATFNRAIEEFLDRKSL
jgi:pimeloyl-ACP methyl ester carboxylesterase